MGNAAVGMQTSSGTKQPRTIEQSLRSLARGSYDTPAKALVSKANHVEESFADTPEHLTAIRSLMAKGWEYQNYFSELLDLFLKLRRSPETLTLIVALVSQVYDNGERDYKATSAKLFIDGIDVDSLVKFERVLTSQPSIQKSGMDVAAKYTALGVVDRSNLSYLKRAIEALLPFARSPILLQVSIERQMD